MLAVGIMKILQIIGTVMCLLLAIIAIELHGLQPIRQGEMDALRKAGDGKKILELRSKLPVVSVQGGYVSVQGGHVMVDSDQPIKVEVDGTVDVKGTVSAEGSVFVKGAADVNGGLPIDVRIRQ